MDRKIFRNILLVAVLALLLSGILIFSVLYGFFDDRVRSKLEDEAIYIGSALERVQDKDAYLEAIGREEARITWIDGNGVVRFDSDSNPGEMENHLERPEIQRAIVGGSGQAARYSDTLHQKTIYFARRLEDGTVLRLSETQSNIWSLMMSLLPSFGVALIALAILSAVLARVLAKRIIKPIDNLDLEHPLEKPVYDEFAPFLRRLEEQNGQIGRQMEELQKRQQEFNAILENMQEGLVLTDGKGVILSINYSACKIFGIIGKPGDYILSLARRVELQQAIERAGQGQASETDITIDHRIYQLIASPVKNGGAVGGIVLIMMDRTEQREAEQMRREFSANVSHELKTPLTSISGYAEIMKDGLVRPEDMPEFAGRIFQESNRLIRLVEDILELSKLDEGGAERRMEEVELLALAQEMAGRLTGPAAKAEVSLAVSGQAQTVKGVRYVLEEMLYNLIDNGIKYNRPGGRVEVLVEEEEGRVVLAVRDDGIGIPKEHQDKVFQRFYRVDKSHSKQTGGTGLGLSILKHGARLHGAKVELMSEEGAGTTVRVVFGER